MTLSLETFEKVEFDAVDRLSLLPPGHPIRARLQQALINIRVAKRKMLSENPEVLRKSATNNGRRDLVCDQIAATAMAKAACDRTSEEKRLGHHHRDEIPDAGVLSAIKSALAKPITGDRRLVGFLSRSATAS